MNQKTMNDEALESRSPNCFAPSKLPSHQSLRPRNHQEQRLSISSPLVRRNHDPVRQHGLGSLVKASNMASTGDTQRCLDTPLISSLASPPRQLHILPATTAISIPGT